MVARRLTIAMTIAGLALAGCGSSSKSSGSTTTSTATGTPKARPKVTITAKDFSYALPAQIPAGYVDVTLTNQGKEDHQAQFVKLGSMTFDQFKTVAIGTEITKVKFDTIFVGGPNGVPPGASVSATVKLDAGEYAVLCFIPSDSDGKAHVAKGMIGTVKVVETAASVEVAPTATATITLGDFSFTLPPAYTGNGIVDVSNQGAQAHELILLKEVAGATFAQVKAFLLTPPGSAPPAGPPPITEVGGSVGLSSQQHAWLDLHLTPGKYVLTCFLPDPQKGGLPHAVEGMIKEFTIT